MNALVGGANAILLLLVAMAIITACAIAFIASRRRRSAVARTILSGAAILAASYGAGVIAASASSREQTLAAGETKWFCGFYLDCHLGMSVERTETSTSIATSNGSMQAKGVFHIVTLQLHNSAKNPNIDMTLYRPVAKVVDASGREYSRSAVAEAAFAGSESRPGPLPSEAKVTHEETLATMVFDLPSDIQQPRLLMTEGWIVDRVIELGLINDENSLFHKKTLLSLESAPRRTASEPAG